MQGLHDRLMAVDDVVEAVVAEQVDSTNLVVARRVAANAGPGVVAVAERQTAGRGRRGRTWSDVPAGNVALSMSVALPSTAGSMLSLVAALALADVVADLGLDTSLKWPNDVRLLVAGRARKAAGILVEGHPGATPPCAVVGIGVDVDWRGVDRERDDASGIGGTGPASQWTSLAEAAGREVDRADLVVDLVVALQSWCRRLDDDPASVRRAYRGACDTLGQNVRVALGTGWIRGWASDLDEHGSLVVTTPDGREVVTAGDVVHVRED